MQYLCLVIQRDITRAQNINRELAAFGFRPHHVTTIRLALQVTRQWRFDVALVDADCFPEPHLVELLAAMRDAKLPIIVSSDATDESVHIRRLEDGATGLVSKSNSLRLIALRLRKIAELRRQEVRDLPQHVELGPLRIDTRRARASVGGEPLEVSSRQLEILLTLATRPGEFVQRQDFSSSSRYSSDEGSRSLDMHVSRLRAKLRQAGCDALRIHTVHGLGYTMCCSEEDADVDGVSTLNA